MRVTRVFTGDDGRSHFEDLEVPLSDAPTGQLSDLLPALGLTFRESPPGLSMDFHPAPRRQFVITLRGAAEIECGDGSVRRVGPGDVLLADDLTGQGHVTREVASPWCTSTVRLPDGFSIDGWRRQP